MIEAYYVIKCLMHDDDSWDDERLIYHYAYGKSTYISWSPFPDDARKFKTISEIRRFITTSLKSGLASYDNDIGDWIFWRITIIPASDVITPVHTMGLLRSVHER
jgi:hypothetical protein